MTQTIDANILLYASTADAPEHDRAIQLIEHVGAGPGLVIVLWPVVMAYLRIATHPAIFPSPLTHAEAVANIRSLLDRPHVRPAGEIDGFWSAYAGATDGVSVRGNLVPDAHLVALMRQHGISSIWSRDRDFRRFDGIRVDDPFDDRFAEGFRPAKRPQRRR